MKLYNITFNLDDTRTTLIPTIPVSAGTGEDTNIKRICLSDSIAHCMQALACNHRDVRKESRFIVREFDIDPNDCNLIYPEELFFGNYVPDALENNEYWYLRDLSANVYTCEITSFKHDYCLAYTCIKPKDCLRILRRYDNLFNALPNESSEHMHKRFEEQAATLNYWDMIDEVFEDLRMLPWAAKTEIYDLCYKRI